MTAMTIVETPASPPEARSFLPWGRELTRADLDALPDDGHRYELIDGVLIVTPAPRILHQRVSTRLIAALLEALPADLELVHAPAEVLLVDNTVIQPDLLVAPPEAFTEKNLPVAPLIAVEILSSSTRRFDLALKKGLLQEAGCPHYWVVDPDEPSIIAWELHDGVYREAARATADDTFAVSVPFPVALRPASLVP